MCMAFPDPCKVPAPPAPPVVVPFPNMGQLVQANPGTASKRVKILNQAVVLMNTQITMTSGDEGGPLGGQQSGTIKGPACFKKGSQKVKIEGQPVVYLTCTTGQNGTNANAPNGVLMQVAQAQVLVAG